MTTTSLLCPDAFLSPLEIDDAVDARAGRGPRPRRRRDLDRHHPRRHAGARHRGRAQGRRDRGAAAGRRRIPPTGAGDRDRRARARRRRASATKTALMTVTGPARAVLAAERAALNLLGHLSGVATATHEFVRRVAGTSTRICCTRKTTPGLRALEKYAVRCGGGFNHRFGLDDAMLIKDNHIAVAGGDPRRARACARLRRASGQDRDRGRHPRPAARGARCRPRRRGAARQHGCRRDAQGGRDGRWPAGASKPRAASRSTTSPRSPPPASTTLRPAGSRIRRPTSTSRSISRCEAGPRFIAASEFRDG